MPPQLTITDPLHLIPPNSRSLHHNTPQTNTLMTNSLFLLTQTKTPPHHQHITHQRDLPLAGLIPLSSTPTTITHNSGQCGRSPLPHLLMEKTISTLKTSSQATGIEQPHVAVTPAMQRTHPMMQPRFFLQLSPLFFQAILVPPPIC